MQTITGITENRIVVKKLCGCIHSLHGEHGNKKWAEFMRGRMYMVEVSTVDISNFVFPSCPHGTQEEQLAALVRQQAAELEAIRAALDFWGTEPSLKEGVETLMRAKDEWADRCQKQAVEIEALREKIRYYTKPMKNGNP